MSVPAIAIRVVTVVVAFAPSSVAMAQEKSLIPEHFILGRMRILYVKEGLSAVSPGDVDENGVPDQVENVAKQLWAAHRLFCEGLQFPDPFKSERYKDLTCIQVSVRHSTEIGGVNGVAFENAQRARLIPEGKREDRALVMAISSQLDPIRNGTPAHEMFHLIQYSPLTSRKGGIWKVRLAGQNMHSAKTVLVSLSTRRKVPGHRFLSISSYWPK